MNKMIQVFVFCFVFIYSSVSNASNFTELIKTSSKWIFDEQRKMSDDEIKKKVNEYFRKEVVLPMFQSLAEELGGGANTQQTKVLFDALPIISFFIKLSLANSSGPSESQVMLKVLLTAIENAKTDIVRAVDQVYQDETEAKLQAIIHQLNIYNLYSLETQKASYVTMLDLSYSASEIKKRLQQRAEKTIENAHLYLLVSSLHMEIERQKIAILNYVSFPGYSDAFIKQRSDEEFFRVANYMVDDGLSYIGNAYVGSVDAWREEYKKVITNDISWIRDEAGRKIFGYLMNSKPIEFSVIKGSAARPNMNPPYKIFDSLGNYYKTFYFSGSASNQQLATELKNHVDGMLNLVRKDPASFDKFLLRGYVPIQTAFDGWWRHVGKSGARPASAIDQYVINIPQSSYPSLCYSSGNAGKLLGTTMARVPELSIDAVHACYPCAYTKTLSSGTYTHKCGQ